jgi:glycosyl transferase family 87
MKISTEGELAAMATVTHAEKKSVPQAVLRAQDWLVALFTRYPWIGWAAWLAFCLTSLLRTHPRRFGSTFQAYLNAADHFWHAQPIYALSNPADLWPPYIYWPVSLLILGPLPMLDPTVAAAIAMAVSAALLAWASFVFLTVFLPDRSRIEIVKLTGLLLMINIPAAWYNFKYVQAQIGMTAFMMLTSAAIARSHWLKAAFWLFLSAVTKPLSLVMLLLCAATQPRMRIALAAALVVALLLPYAFVDATYLTGEYKTYYAKLSLVAAAAPGQWLYQADFATLLDSIGIVLPSSVATGIRFAAALGTLGLVWHVARMKNQAVFAMAVILFSACYITLFGPRNEFLSFLVLTPPLTALALVLLIRDAKDQRSWLLVLMVIVVGFHWNLEIDRALKPLLTFIILGWLIWLSIEPSRWAALLNDASAAPQTKGPGNGPAAASSAV